MNRPTKLLLGVSLLAAVLSIGASTSSSKVHAKVASGGGPVAHSAAVCQIPSSGAFDTNWNESSISPPSLNPPLVMTPIGTPFTDFYPYGTVTATDSDINSWTNHVDPSTYYLAPDYYSVLDLSAPDNVPDKYQLQLYNSGPTSPQMIDDTGNILAIGSGYVFFVGPWPSGGNGTILSTSPMLGLALHQQESLTVDILNPTGVQVQEALACPTITSVVGGDGQVSLTWNMPAADPSIVGYTVYVDDVTSPNAPSLTSKFFSLSSYTNLDTTGGTQTVPNLVDGDDYEFSVAANYNWPLGIGAGISSNPSITVTPNVPPTTTTTVPPTTTTTVPPTTTTTTTVPPTTTTTLHPPPPATSTTTSTTSTTTTTTTTVPPTTTTTVPPTTTTTTPLAASTSTTTPLGAGDLTTTTTSPTTSDSIITSPPGEAAPTSTTAPTTTTTLPPQTDANIAFCGSPGVPIANCQLTIQGQGLEPNTDVTVEVHSTPTKVGSTTVDPNGSFNVAASLPKDLAIGVHHVIVSGTSANGEPFSESEVFTVVKGERLGAIGWVPPQPLEGDIQFVPSSHRTVVLAATAGVTAAAAAVASGLGGGLAFGGGAPVPVGGAPSGGGPSGGARGPAGATLEDVELERLEGDTRENGLGDRSRFWRWPGTRLLDRWSKNFPRKAASISPVAGRVIVDGDYLRAMLGSIWVGLCLASVGLGAYASASSGWYAVPPSLGLFLGILALGIFDSMLGFLAGASFIACSFFAGHITSAPELRLSMGLVLIWFAVPLAAAALRPLRRTVSLKIDALWDRVADLVVCGLFAAWVADKMTSALSGLSGVELPINHDVGKIVLAVIVLVGARIVAETVVAHHFPGRLASVRHEGKLESGKLQRVVSLVAQVVVFDFVASAILGGSWVLVAGTVIFFTPHVLELFEHRLPKSRTVAKWKPNGIITWALIISVGVVLGELLKHTVHSGHLVEEIGFIVLPIPVLTLWTIELFEAEDAEPQEHEANLQAENEKMGSSKRAPKTISNAAIADETGTAKRGESSRARLGASSVAVLEHPAPRSKGAQNKKDPDGAALRSTSEAALALRQRRSKARVVLEVPEPESTGSNSLARNRKANKRVEDASSDGSGALALAHARSLVVRKWTTRVAGLLLVIVSVLLVHVQGGG